MQNLNINPTQGDDLQPSDLHSLQYYDFPLISDVAMVDNSYTATHANLQNQHDLSRNLSEDEIFKGLPSIAPLDNVFPSHNTPPNEWLLPSESCRRKSNSKSVDVEDDDDAETEFIKKNKQLKRIRSTYQNQVHNLSEQKRRDRIKTRLNILRSLIPNCSKSDRASMLSDAADYLKSLKFELDMRQRQAMWQLAAGFQNNSTPQFMPFMPMGIGMGMVNMCGYLPSGTGHTFEPIPDPSTTNTPSSLPLFPEPSFVSLPQFQPPPPISISHSPFMAGQVMPTSSTITTIHPQLLPYTLDPANQGESSTSQFMDHHQNLPTLGYQKPNVMASRMTLPAFRSIGRKEIREPGSR